MMYVAGDKVRIREEWRDAGESDEVYVVVAGDEEGRPRVDIEPEVTTMTIRPRSVVAVWMVEPV